MDTDTNNTNNALIIPAAIVVAGIIVAGAIMFTNTQSGGQKANVSETNAEIIQPEIRAIGPQDHILGNPNLAEVFIVEYSDLECPFCKTFHETLKQIIEEYGPNGPVAWVYRHFPLVSIHPKALPEAEATECAAELGGEGAFWEYTDRIFQITPSNNGLDLSLLPEIAVEIGLTAKDFNECLKGEKHIEKVQSDTEDAIASGGLGTPHSILVTKDGKRSIAIEGAQSVATVRAAIEQLLKN